MELTFRSKDLEVTVREPGDGLLPDKRLDSEGYTYLLYRLLSRIELSRIEYILASVIIELAEAGETGRMFEAESDSFVDAATKLVEKYDEHDVVFQGEIDCIMKGQQNGTA